MKLRKFPIAIVLFTLGIVAAPAAAQDYAYVTNFEDNTLSVVNLSTREVVATIPVGTNPQGVAINPAGTRVYTANYGTFDGQIPSDVTVIDAETNTVVDTVPVDPTISLAVHPDGTRVFVANGENISVLDRATNAIIGEVGCGDLTGGVALSPDGSTAYATRVFGGDVCVVDTTTLTRGDDIDIEPGLPVSIAVHPQGKYVYAGDRFGPILSVIDPAVNEEVATLSVGSALLGLALDRSGGSLYVADVGFPPDAPGNTVFVINTETLTVIDTVEIEGDPVGVDVHPDGRSVWVANEPNFLSAFDTATNTVTDTIAVGAGANAFGQFIGPGVPRELKQDARDRLDDVKEKVAMGAPGVGNPAETVKAIERAISYAEAALDDELWAGYTDPRRLYAEDGDKVFNFARSSINKIFDAIEYGEIEDPEILDELLAIADELVRADRVLAAVAIDDAIVGTVDPKGLPKAQAKVIEGDALAEAAAAEQDLQQRGVLLRDAITEGYRAAWKALMKPYSKE